MASFAGLLSAMPDEVAEALHAAALQVLDLGMQGTLMEAHLQVRGDVDDIMRALVRIAQGKERNPQDALLIGSCERRVRDLLVLTIQGEFDGKPEREAFVLRLQEGYQRVAPLMDEYALRAEVSRCLHAYAVVMKAFPAVAFTSKTKEECTGSRSSGSKDIQKANREQWRIEWGSVMRQIYEDAQDELPLDLYSMGAAHPALEPGRPLSPCVFPRHVWCCSVTLHMTLRPARQHRHAGAGPGALVSSLPDGVSCLCFSLDAGLTCPGRPPRRAPPPPRCGPLPGGRRRASRLCHLCDAIVSGGGPPPMHARPLRRPRTWPRCGPPLRRRRCGPRRGCARRRPAQSKL